MKADLASGKRELNLSPRDSLIADRYKVIECLGFGEQTALYRCHDLKCDSQEVTVKTLHLNLCQDEVITRRFHQEVMASFQVESQNTVRSIDYFKTSEVIGYSMEYSGKSTLKDLLDKEQPIAIERVLNILIQICDGLDAIHQAGIIHRDIKPGNIFILGDGTVKISDFGIARLTFAPKLTIAGEVRGSIGYASPEYLEFGRVDSRSDIYALGLVAYEMISGSFPFIASSPIAALKLRLTSDPRPLSLLRSDCSEGISQAISVAMQRDPLRRFESAREFKEALLLACRPQPGKVIPMPQAAKDQAAIKQPKITPPESSIAPKESALSNTGRVAQTKMVNTAKPLRRPQLRLGRYLKLMFISFILSVLGIIAFKLLIPALVLEQPVEQTAALQKIVGTASLATSEITEVVSEPVKQATEVTVEDTVESAALTVVEDPAPLIEETIPEIQSVQVAHTEAENTQSEEVSQRKSYTVRRADTVFKVAQKFGVSQESLLNLNNIINPNILVVGQELTIPAVNEVIKPSAELLRLRSEAIKIKEPSNQPEIISVESATIEATPQGFLPVTSVEEVLRINNQALGTGQSLGD